MMWSQLIRLSPLDPQPLQVQIRRAVVSAISEGLLPSGTRLPSSRELASILDVARNTVVLAYQHLADDGLITSAERAGHFVAERAQAPALSSQPDRATLAWSTRFARTPSRDRNIVKPREWQKLAFPFVHGQPDPALFPVNEWRHCVHSALAALEIRDWSRDGIDGDDPQLTDEIRKHVLPLRGVWAGPGEVMITLGAQQALFLIATLLVKPGMTFGIEEPGYPDARNIARLAGATVAALPIDAEGLVIGEALAACDIAFVTPSHQCPTTVTMPMGRRRALLEAASAEDVLVIEDDYEIETPAGRTPLPALKSLDASGRVLYVGSLSKTFAPGLRLGYVVAPEPVIAELRALRRLMLRHPPANNQRAAASFIALGHYEAHLKRYAKAMAERGETIDEALRRFLPQARLTRDLGATSAWVELPGTDTEELAARALQVGILVEAGGVFFDKADDYSRHFLRLGFSAIPTTRIEAGIEKLASLL